MQKELLGIFKISVGNFMRNGCHVGLVELIWRGLKQNSTLAWNPEYLASVVIVACKWEHIIKIWLWNISALCLSYLVRFGGIVVVHEEQVLAPCRPRTGVSRPA